jgi:hypothetical protein
VMVRFTISGIDGVHAVFTETGENASSSVS